MWNYNVKRGSIWSVKSINQYDEHFIGMSAGPGFVLINNAFTDNNGFKKFTYFKIVSYKNDVFNNKEINIDNKTYYIQMDNILTGQQEALERYETSLPFDQINNLIKSANSYFNLNLKHKKDKNMKYYEEFQKLEQQRIFKYGIEIYVTENKDVSISHNKKLILSEAAKYDILSNSKTDEDILNLCNKYKIYPINAIKQIKNRLVYQQKHK